MAHLTGFGPEVTFRIIMQHSAFESQLWIPAASTSRTPRPSFKVVLDIPDIVLDMPVHRHARLRTARNITFGLFLDGSRLDFGFQLLDLSYSRTEGFLGLIRLNPRLSLTESTSEHH